MKKYLYIYVLLTITILLMAGCTTGGIPQLPVDNPEDSLDEITGVPRVVFIELFNTDGCPSSKVVNQIMEELVSEYDHTQVILVEEAGWGIYSTEETSERFQWYLLDKSDLHTPLVCFDGLNQLFAQSFSSGGDESTGTCHLTTGGSVTVISNNNEDTEYNAAPVPTTVNTTTPDPIISNTEEPVIVDTEETETESPQKWSGLGMMLFNTLGFDNHIDTLLTNGFTEIRMSSDWYSWDLDTSSQSAIISAITKGAQVIWGVQSSGATLTAANCSDYANAVKAAAQWAQDNGIYEFSIGNEEEAHVDGTTLTGTQVITNLKALATEVKEIFTIGNISYSYAWGYIDNWIAEGKGDIDLIAYNLQKGSETSTTWKTTIDKLVNAFGVDGTYLTEFYPNVIALDDYSTDEAVQAAAVTEMIEYVKASGMKRAIYFCWKSPSWLQDLGVVKDDGTYRLLWNQALLNSGSTKSITVPNTIALLPRQAK